jgi:hypothetical protein
MGNFLAVALTFSRNTVPHRGTYLYAATVLFSLLLFPIVSFLVTDIYFMCEMYEFWRCISSTPRHVLNHMLEFTTSFSIFTSVLHVDELLSQKRMDSEVKKCNM